MEKRNYYTQTDACKTFIWALLVPQAISLLVALIFAQFYSTQEELSNSLVYLFVATILAQLCFLAVAYFYNKNNKINFVQASKLNLELNIKNVLICVLISMVAVFGLYNFINMISGFFVKLGFGSSSVSLPNNTFYWFIINVVLLAIIPAIMEEFIFRGMIFNGLRKSSFIVATIVSSVMFALIHLSINQFVYPIIMGIVFSFVLEKTGSLAYSMIVHCCNNFIVILISYINNCIGYDFLNIGVNNAGTFLIVTLIACLALVIVFVLIKFALKKQNNGIVQQSKNNEQDNNLPNIQNDCSNDLTNPDKKRQYYRYLIGALASGVLIWIIYVLSELMV